MSEFFTTPEYFNRLRKAYQKWIEEETPVPPSDIPLHDRFTKKTIYNVLGSNTMNALPHVEELCRHDHELAELREYVWGQLKNREITRLASLCSEVSSRITAMSNKESRQWAEFYQGLVARRIQRHKIQQPDSDYDYHRGIEMPLLLKVSKLITERIFVALDEMATRVATPDEAFFELKASIAHTLNKHMERLTLKRPKPIKKMFNKAYHSIREAISGVYILEQNNTLSIWGSARSCPWYDVIAEEVAYNCAQKGFSVKSGAGPGTMDAALKGCHRHIKETLEKGQDPIVEAIGLPGNFEKLDEEPSLYMTYRIDHFDLDIRKLLLRTSNVILIFPGRAGTDEEFFSTLVELLTDYSNIAEEDKGILPNVVVVGDYQRKSLLHHIIVEISKYKNKHNDDKPLFYFVDTDHQALKEEHGTGNQLSGPLTQSYIDLLTRITLHCERSLQQDLSSFSDPQLINSIDLREQYKNLQLQ